MSALEILQRMETIINGAGTDDNWTQGAVARKADDSPCAALHPDAVKWDLMGALQKANWEWNVDETNDPPIYTHYHEALDLIRDYFYSPTVPFENPLAQYNSDFEKWNDDESESHISAIVTANSP